MILPQWFEICTQEMRNIFEFLVYYCTHRGSVASLTHMKGLMTMMYRYFPGRMMFGGHLFGLLLAVLLVVGIVLLIVVLASRKNKAPIAQAAPGATASAAPDRFLTILNEQKAASGMGTQEYEERKLVLEGGRTDNHANAEIVALKERYARGELTTSAYVEARSKLLGLS